MNKYNRGNSTTLKKSSHKILEIGLHVFLNFMYNKTLSKEVLKRSDHPHVTDKKLKLLYYRKLLPCLKYCIKFLSCLKIFHSDRGNIELVVHGLDCIKKEREKKSLVYI